MNRADRMASLGLFALAVAAWVGVAVVLIDFDPRANASVLLVGALLIGTAVGLTLLPLLWLVGFAAQGRTAFPGDWWRALRRAALVGLIVALFVVLRGENALNLPLAMFVAAMALLVELTLSLRR
ncbi:MAG: hypothetical protein ABI744_01335 [Chloroflexota bacterium]